MSGNINITISRSNDGYIPSRFEFNNIDVRFFNNQKALLKIQRLIKYSPIDIDIIISLTERPGGILSKDISDIILNPNKLTAVLIHNGSRSGEYKPLTGWMMAHKIYHGIHFNKNLTKYIENHIIFERMLTLAIMGKYDLLVKQYNGEYYWQDNPKVNSLTEHKQYDLGKSKNGPELFGRDRHRFHPVYDLAYNLLTMKSARNKNINTIADILAELGAQFLINGKVIFNRSDIVAPSLVEKEKVKLDEYISETEMIINEYIHNELVSFIDKVIRI